MKICISADVTCDLPPWLAEQYDITLISIPIIKGDKAYFDGVDITNADIFRYFEETGKLCTTSALNPAQYLEHFKRLREKCDALIHIDIGSAMSACHQNARIAAMEIDNVYVVDSQNLSSGFGYIVLEAAIMAREGKSPEEIIEGISKIIPLVETSFVIDKLTYLYKGGRCSALAALGANLMNLKPCIEVRDGEMKVGKKYRGNFETVILKYVEDKLANRDDIDYSRIFITHPACPDSIVKSVEKRVKELGNFDEVLITNAGGSVSVHCGPMTLGIIFKRKA